MLEYQDREWEVEEILQRNKKGANIPVPDWYSNKKGVPDELRWFWSAFWELDTCRGVEEGVPRRIPWNIAKEYAEYHEIDFDYFWHLIVVLDNVYVENRAAKRRKELEDVRKSAKTPKSHKGKRRG